MVEQQAVYVCIFLVTLGVPSGGSAEVDHLKTSVEQLIGALNKRHLDAWSPFVHDQAVGFGLISPFAAESKAV